MSENKYRTVDEYIAACSPEIQPKLKELKKLILAAEPELKEKISWQMPTFYTKYNIIHFAAHKNHIGIYPGPETIEKFADRLSDYKTSKGAFQIPYDKAIDEKLIADMIHFNMAGEESFSG